MANSFTTRIFICEIVRIFVVSYFMHGQSTVYSCALHVNNMNYYSEQDFTLSFSCDGSESYSGRTLIIINYYIMCIITQIVVPITPKFVFVLTKFGKPGKHLVTVINNSALYKKMFRHE